MEDLILRCRHALVECLVCGSKHSASFCPNPECVKSQEFYVEQRQMKWNEANSKLGKETP